MSEMRELLAFLGSRYVQARSQRDEIRARALEMVVAACVGESRGRPPPGETPPPAPSDALVSRLPTSPPVVTTRTDSVPLPEPPPIEDEIDEDSAAAFWAELEAEPEPEPEPEPTALEQPVERGPVVDREPDPGSHRATAPLVWPPASGEDVPEEPVRGSWDPPER